MHIRFDQTELRYGEHSALKPLTLALSEQRIGVIGLNGSGKTSFARLINGLAKPTSGTVTLDGLDTVKDERAVLSRTGFIFQNPANQIILPIIRDDIAMGPKSRGLKGPALEAAVDRVLERFGITHLAGRRPHELSGGELQLAALAAVVVTEPGLILFDEPTNQLDLKNRAMVKAAIEGLAQQAIVITHDLDLISDYPRVLVFHEGALAFDGQGEEAVQRYIEIAGA
ncbi:ABC transporter ATP-binding protein [Rhizobium sp. CECT 9324]|uniref:energy-coupling factor ABC transporter ATP-binding protein n=1 Tax=Rhizobium sp. CECT 9324 TaxID=2845820 RepID=UPI001E3EE4B7|nr:ABC transporter ATP-binding protein [Rhizobium sp. CECT 9324]CAH0339806.1 Biotin transport ATP-binding protein BioM [Rhizobium sp. CECT 9324]